MAQATVTKTKAPNVLQLIFWLVANLVIWSILAGLASYVITVVLVALRGEQYSINLLQHLMYKESDYLLRHAANTASFITLQYWSDSLHNVLGLWHIPGSSSLIPIAMQHTIKEMGEAFLPYIKIIVINSQLLLLRFYLLYCWLPLIVLMGSIGLVDGLVARSIRRASMGRESVTIYFHAKGLVLFSLVMAIFIVQTLPIPVKQSEIGFIAAISVFTLALYLSAKQFKKYL